MRRVAFLIAILALPALSFAIGDRPPPAAAAPAIVTARVPGIVLVCVDTCAPTASEADAVSAAPVSAGVRAARDVVLRRDRALRVDAAVGRVAADGPAPDDPRRPRLSADAAWPGRCRRSRAN
jgi:hypothetical protein